MTRKRLALKLKEQLSDQDINAEVKQPKTKRLKIEEPLVELNESNLLNITNLNRLNSEFYNQNCIELSKSLLGKYLIRIIRKDNSEQKCLVGKIVECEAYLGGDDKASHTYNGKKTERLTAMYMKPGTLYVYNIYGMYCCMNISAKEAGAGVLIRALEPIHCIETMKSNRKQKPDLKMLTNGPSKLCLAFNITKNEFNQTDLESNKDIWIQDQIGQTAEELTIIKTKRVGIDYSGEEAINKLYRFYIKNNQFVSVKSKIEIEESN